MQINTDEQARPWVARCKAWMRQNGFAGLDGVKIRMRNPGCAGMAYCGRDLIDIAPGYGEMYFCEILVHELCHHWLYRHGHEAGGFSGEGAAEWVAYRFLQQIGTAEALYHAQRLLTSHPQARGVDYSVALAHMLRRAS